MNKEAELKRLAKKVFKSAGEKFKWVAGEKERLASIVFEGAGDDVTCASMGLSGIWMCFDLEPVLTDMKWFFDPYRTNWAIAKNQPETTLEWTETLLRRADYE